jgi:hypothetical protein
MSTEKTVISEEKTRRMRLKFELFNQQALCGITIYTHRRVFTRKKFETDRLGRANTLFSKRVTRVSRACHMGSHQNLLDSKTYKAHKLL